MKKADLVAEKLRLKRELDAVEKKLAELEVVGKPYEAALFGYSSPGRSSMRFKTEEQARTKYEEYTAKRYFRNGRVDGTVLYKYEEDGARKVLEFTAKVPWFKVPQ